MLNIDPQLVISLFLMRTLGSRSSKDTSSRHLWICGSMTARTRPEQMLRLYNMLPWDVFLCSTLFRLFVLPNLYPLPESGANTHTHFHCAVVLTGRKFQFNAFFLFSFWCQSKVNARLLPTSPTQNTPTLQLSVGRQTLPKMQLCMSLRCLVLNFHCITVQPPTSSKTDFCHCIIEV